ncbi:DUF2750 domain-containing protein [Leptospira montravelensis]|uniref:DUF2750 domain-containing protein n=1 Tax=Leptospira montravelensis TaxID=2484961 RepID=A0ABY2LL35_9LEPT|nr:DUF2750 domain-containing protein [Leptospira montravelensis]TGK86135.1 DUF2750 domain-containing protein [Leptospira montravelensis]TGK95012.1 DUF2750 domain-containing protein [Leptospira montravelensis]
MKITQKQIDIITSLPGPKRYEHFIKVAADQRCVWGLYNAGWALAGTDDGQHVFPLWPAYEYSSICTKNEWLEFKPKKIELDSLFDDLLPSLKERKTLIGVFYTPSDKGVIPNMDDFEKDLRHELSRIE